jgi:hypothetical protein
MFSQALQAILKIGKENSENCILFALKNFQNYPPSTSIHLMMDTLLILFIRKHYFLNILIQLTGFKQHYPRMNNCDSL